MFTIYNFFLKQHFIISRELIYLLLELITINNNTIRRNEIVKIYDPFRPKAFELIAKRKPAPRVFCDICDEFDKHETEGCPLQASDVRDYSPPPLTEATGKKIRKLPEPRKYCETCEGKCLPNYMRLR